MSSTSSLFDPSLQHGDTDAKIVAALERLSRVFRVLLWEEAKETGLSPIQIQFLVYVRFHDESRCRVGDLAKEFDLTPATVSEAVSTLEAKGLLVKVSDPKDRRVRMLRLTDEGTARTGTLSGWADALKIHLGGHSYAEKILVMRFLMDLIGQLQVAGVITTARMCTTCRFFGENQHDDPEAPHHCRLLDKPLRLHELRLDCPEYEEAS